MAKDNVAEDLRAELKTLADTLEEVLNSSTDKSKEEIGKLRSKAESALKESRVRLGETSDALLKQTRETAARADEYVRESGACDEEGRCIDGDGRGGRELRALGRAKHDVPSGVGLRVHGAHRTERHRVRLR